ncbi:MAG: hypothetical protein GY839_02390 [candidate division Zixibacteria bacterium]|nr:hypothetical protein [candidate division Zixibacteria bacterium]
MKYNKILLLCLAIVLIFGSSSSAQDPDWFTNLNINTYPSPYVSDWERDPSIGALFVGYQGGAEVTYYYQVEIERRFLRSGQLLLAESNLVTVDRPFRTTVYSTEFIEWRNVDYNEAYEEQVVRSGRLPEGEYYITVSLITRTGQLLAEDGAPFYIVYPDPPQLILPSDGEAVAAPYPTFQWTPVVTPPDYLINYHLLIVERLAGQSLQRAIDANYPHHEDNNAGMTFYSYPMSGLAFEDGREYVWQITATDQYGFAPTSNRGRSEIWSFFYGEEVGEIVDNLPFDTLVIEPGTAYLVNLDDLTITEDQVNYTLNGSTELALTLPGDLRASINVDVNNLVIEKIFLDAPTILSGGFSGNLDPGDIPESLTGEYFLPENIEFDPAGRLTIGGRLNLPREYGQYDLLGRISLTGRGLSGQVSVTGSPLFSFGNDIAQLNINEATLTFSMPSVSFSGMVELLGVQAECSLDDLTLNADGTFSGLINCGEDLSIPLVPESDRFALNLTGLSGRFEADLADGSLDFDILSSGGLEFQPDEETRFGADISLRIHPLGVSVESFTPRGDLEFSAIDLGWLQLQLSGLSLETLSYTGGNWDFALGMDIEFGFPYFDNLAIPGISGVSFTSAGFSIPETEMPVLYLPRFELEGFEFEMMALRFEAMTFPWFDWDGVSPADFGFDFDLRLRFPNFPEGTPIELSDPEIIISNASFINGNFSATLPAISFAEPGLRLPLAEAVGMLVQEISGSFGASFDGGEFSFSPDIHLRGGLQLPPAFSCEGEGQTMDLLSTSIGILGDGKLTGMIEDLVPSCSLHVGLLSLAVGNSNLSFYIDEDQQRIQLEGTANLGFNSPGGAPIDASVTFGYEFIQNQLLALEGNINTAFVWDIPPSEPVLSFNISSAEIDETGITINGRQSLRFSDETTLGVTFDNLTVGWEDFGIESGNVTFDLPFALKVAFDGEELIYQAVPSGTELIEPLGILLELPDAISIGADGFTASGTSGIHLRFEDYNLPSLSGVYSPDFAFSLSPFGVSSGQLEFFADDSRIALLDSRGFFPDLSYFGMAFLPERLPLPIEDIAYLQIKTGDELLIEHQTVDGGLRLYTRPGEPISLVVPALQLGRPMAPQLNVEFDFTIDPLDRGLVDGSINVTVPPEQYADFDLSSLGIPFELRNLTYGDVDGLNAFLLDGQLKLFDTSIGGEMVQLKIMPDGRLLGDVNFPISQEIPLVSGSNNVTLSISNIAGSFETRFIPLDISFDLSLAGGIRLNLDESTSYGASTQIGVTEHGIELRDFEVDIPGGLPELDLGALDMYFSNFTIPTLAYDQVTGWDFEIGIDLGMGFPDLGFQLPQMSGVIIGANGIRIPEMSIPELSDSAYTFHGFGLKPLAFRMAAFTFDWFNFSGGPLEDWGFAFDFELSFPEFPDFIPPDLRNPRITILNAGYQNGRFTGSIETKEFDLPGLQLPLGGDLNYYVREIGGNLAVIDDIQNFNVTFRGDIQMPEQLWCEGDSGRTDIMSTEFTVDAGGRLTGTLTNFIPSCPFNIGIGQLAVTNSNVELDISAGNQTAIMDLGGTLRIAGAAEGDTIEASGNISFDLINARILDGEIAINSPFRWQIPDDNPVLVFTINSAVLNSSGLLINGSNSLNLAEGASVAVDFNDLLIDISNFNVVSGNATFSSQFALKFVSELGGLQWSAVGLEAPVIEETGVRLTMPENVSLSTGGISAEGETGVFIRFGGEDHADISCIFSGGFNLGFSPFGVTEGRADFFYDETMVAFLDSDGFHPGDFFGIIPLPEKLPLPDTSVAYIVLKEGDNVLIQTETVEGGLRLSTGAGESVQLVIPALQYEAPEPPAFGISFSVVVNVSTFQLVDGSVEVTPPEGAQSLLSLASSGIPLDLTQLLFSRIGGSPALMASARIALPEELGNVNVSLDSLLISAEGFSGSVTLGTYSEYYQELDNYIVDVPIGDMFSFKVGGVQASFDMDDFAVRLCGDIQTQLFSNESDTAAIHYTAAWDGGQFGFGFDISHIPDAALPLYIATFRPEPIGDSPAFDLSFPDGSFALTLSGTLALEDFGEGFSVSFAGLNISPDGVTMPDINITTPEDFLSFALFSADFEIKDVDSYPGLAFSYESNVFYISLSGELEFLNNTSSFHGLRVGTNGSVSIEGVSLISEELYIVDDYLALTELGIESNALVVEGFAKLPEPCDTSRQTFNFSISPDGTITGGAEIVMINEVSGLGGDDETEKTLWIATFDPIYASLGFNFAELSQSSVKLVADLWFDIGSGDYVTLGIGSNVGGVVNPGLEIKFDGTVRWGNLQTVTPFSVDWDALKLDSLRFASFDTESDDFGLSISGKLNVNISCVGGGLQFQDLRITSGGDVENLAGSIVGGDITITDIVTISISDIGFSSSPTDIQVTGGTSCQNYGGDEQESETNTIHVASYFRFGASIDISDVGGGGIREFLTYTTEEGGTHVIIDSAYVNIPEVVQFSLDFTYEQGPDGFSLLMGGQGVFVNAYSIVVVGKIAHLGGETSFGLFVAVDVTITIPPCLVLTGVGGGFFYNPTECDLALVREMAGFGGDDPASGRISDPGSFAVLLYARIAIVQDFLVQGSVLLTITEGYFRLDGRVILLDQDTYLKGSIYLCVGFRNGFAEGNITVDVTVGDFLVGHTEFGFYVYGAEAWGIYGNIELSVMSIIEANSKLFIGNPGFLIQMSMEASFDIWILEISAGFEAMAWYQVNVSWGMYAKVWVSAEALWGLVSAKGWLEAALIGTGGDWTIYGLAGVKGCVIGICKSASVWCKIDESGIDGGLGRNSEMDDVIEDAKNLGEEMEEEAEDAKEAMDDAIIASFLMSDEDLVEAFNNLFNAGQLLRSGNWVLQLFAALFLADVGPLDEIELGTEPVPSSATGPFCTEHAYYNMDLCNQMWSVMFSAYQQELVQIPNIYENFFNCPDAPSDTERDSLRTLRNRLENLIDSSDDDRGQMSSRMNQVTSSLSGIPGLEFAFANPVSSFNMDDPVGEEYVQGDTTYKRAINQPDFTLDSLLALSNRENMEQAQEEFGQYEEMIVEQISSIEMALQSLDDALEGSDGQVSFGELGGNYADLMYEIGRFFVQQATYAEHEQAYARDKAIELEALAGSITFILNMKSQNFGTRAGGDPLNELRDLAWARKRALLKLRMVPNVDTDSMSDFYSRWTSLSAGNKKEVCTQFGQQLWFDMPHLGFQHLDSVSTEMLVSGAAIQLRDELNNIGFAQSAYTEALDPVFDARVLLTEKLYDILDLYGEWQESYSDTIEWLIPNDQVDSKKSDLMEQLAVPQINSITAAATNCDFYSYGSLNWSASHPRGISEYALMLDEVGYPTPEGIGLQNVGTRMYLTRHFLQLSNHTATNWSMTLRARAGAGYINQRQIDFTTYFSPSGGGGVGSYETYDMGGDATPPTEPQLSFPNYSARMVPTYIPEIGYWVDIAHYYSSSTNEIHAGWASYDDESGVVEYEYGVGTAQGNNNILSWISAGGRNESTIHGISLTGGQTYYVNAHARNGEDMWSTTGHSSRLMIDTTPPSTPAPRYTYVFGGPGGPFGGPYTPPTVIPPIPLPAELVPPIGASEPVFVPYFPGVPPTVAALWHASTDSESDIYEYLYRVISASDTTDRSPDWLSVGDDLEVTAGDEMIDYSDSFYIDIQAVNYAGLLSGTLRQGPKRPVDPSQPSQPIAALSYGLPAGANYLIFTAKSADYETGVAGYQLAVGTLAGATDLVGWGGDVDYGNNEFGPASSLILPDFGLPQGTTCYISLRSVNGQGITSNTCVTGPYLIDNTQPITPVVMPEFRSGHPGYLLLTYSNISDPESGIQYVEYAIGSSNESTNIQSWRNEGLVSSTQVFYHLLGLQHGHTYYIGVRTTNGVNQVSQEFWTSILYP